MTTTLDPRPLGVLQAEQARDIARARAEWDDAQARLADYLGFMAMADRPLCHDTVRELHRAETVARDAYLGMVQR